MIPISGAVQPYVADWLQNQLDAGVASSKSALVGWLVEEAISLHSSRTYRIPFPELNININDNNLNLSIDQGSASPMWLESIELTGEKDLDLDSFFIKEIRTTSLFDRTTETILNQRVRASMLREGNLFRPEGYKLLPGTTLTVTVFFDNNDSRAQGKRIGGWATFKRATALKFL